MDIKFLFYIFLSAVVILGGSFYFMKSHQAPAALVFGAGMLIVMIFFGYRWFTPSGDVQGSAGNWPPVISTCPDFLSLYKLADTGEQVCIDTVGISPGGISKWTDPTTSDERYLFHLYTTRSGDDRVQALCQQCMDKKVTWEGVFDGSTCLGNHPPLPPA